MANRLTSVNGQAYTWDANGNLLSDGLLTYAYNQSNQLKTVTQGANTYTYAYNGVGDRLSQTVNGTQTRYALDLNAGLTQVLADGSNTYLYGNGRIAQQQTNMQYFGEDALGSVRQLYNYNGQVIADERYDPFGNVISQSGSATSAYGFAGEEQDNNTGLVFLRERNYDSAAGRFITPDPLLGHIDRPITWDRYIYGADDPVRYTDPTGLDLFIVAGFGEDDVYDHPEKVDAWIRAYKSWGPDKIGEQQWNNFLRDWESAGNHESTMQWYKVFIFNWKEVQDTGPVPNPISPSQQCQGDSAVHALASDMTRLDMQDITLLGHSEGAAVAQALMSSEVYDSLPPEHRPKNLILTGMPVSEIRDALRITLGNYSANPHARTVQVYDPYDIGIERIPEVETPPIETPWWTIPPQVIRPEETSLVTGAEVIWDTSMEGNTGPQDHPHHGWKKTRAEEVMDYLQVQNDRGAHPYYLP